MVGDLEERLDRLLFEARRVQREHEALVAEARRLMSRLRMAWGGGSAYAASSASPFGLAVLFIGTVLAVLVVIALEQLFFVFVALLAADLVVSARAARA